MGKDKAKNYNLFLNLGRFLEPLKSATKDNILTGVNGILAGLFATYNVIFLQYIIKAIETKSMDDFWKWVVIWGIIIFLWFIRGIFYKRFPFRAAAKMQAYMYDKYMKQIFKGDNTKIERLGTGRLISVVQKGINAHDIILGDHMMRSGTSRFSTLVIALITIWNANVYFFFLGITIFVLSFVLIYIFYPKAAYWRGEAKKADIEIDRTAVRHIMNKFEITQQGKLSEETGKVSALATVRCRYKIKEKIWQGISYDGSEFIANLFGLGIAIYVGLGVYNGIYSFSDFVLLTGLAVLLSGQINKIVDIAKQFSDNRVHLEKLWGVIDDIATKDNFDEGDKFRFKKGAIDIKNMTFSYDNSPIFKDFSIQINGGEKTAFVGPSGGGKTTLIKLIAGFMKPDSGDIIVDGQYLTGSKCIKNNHGVSKDVAVQHLSLASYYRHIGYLTQDPSVFDGTIYENLVYGLGEDTTTSKDKAMPYLKEIITLSKCEFIRKLEHGLDTEIGERGVRLSGGQKQRLAIAKIMLKNPEIILLDEPTSAMDSFNEEEVTQALHNLFKGRTVIVVAHRLQTVKKSDRIIYIEGGKIMEEGTHHELITMGGRYKKMLDLQSGF